MTESAPSYGVRPVTMNVQLLARVLDCDVDELIDRALEEAFDRSLADPDIKAAFDALSRLAARQKAAEDASADYGMRETSTCDGTTRPFTDVRVHCDEPDELEQGDDLDEEGDAEEEVSPPPAPRAKGPTLTTAQRRMAASVVLQARRDRGLAQSVVADALGMSVPTLSRVENADPAVSSKSVRKAVEWAQAK